MKEIANVCKWVFYLRRYTNIVYICKKNIYMASTESIAEWIFGRAIRGLYTFTHEDVLDRFPDKAPGTLAQALTREVRKNRIMSPVRGFYVTIPEDYRLRGMVPQSFYMDRLMLHLDRNYYVGLLNAAQYHGASHQVPLNCSVMIEPPAMREKQTARYHTRFFCKTQIPVLYVERRQVRTGYLNISSPELTAIDLITFQESNGGITRAASVLAELVDKTRFANLAPGFVEVAPLTSFQRLGFILEEVLAETEAADAVYALLSATGRKIQYVPLKTGGTSVGCPRNKRWQIIENETIEMDEI